MGAVCEYIGLMRMLSAMFIYYNLSIALYFTVYILNIESALYQSYATLSDMHNI